MKQLKALCIIVLLTLIAACTKAGTSTENTAGGGGHNGFTQAHYLRFADAGGDLSTLNPVINSETRLAHITQMTMAYLARYDHNNKPIPELLTVIPTEANGGISKDGKTITWHLRKGVKWSDGAPFNADDMVFSTNVVNNKANNVVGRDGWNLITKMDEPDKYTVVYHLSKPYAAYLPTFFGTAGANPCLLPKHLLGDLPNINQAPYNAKPVGIGPFRVVAWKRGDSVELEANPYYWRGLPKLKRVTYKLTADRNTLLTQIQTGDVDLWPLVPAGYIDRAKSVATFETVVVPSYYFAHIDMNLKNPILQDVRVREALRYALDRKTLVDKTVYGYGILQETMVSPANPVSDQKVAAVPFDLAKAKQLLDDAGWKVGPDGIRVKDGKKLTLHFASYTGAPDTDNRIELMRSNWKDAGIEIQLQKYAPAVFFEQPNGIVYGGKFDLTTFSWGGDVIGELSNLYECNQAPPNGQNMMHYCNPKVDAAMEHFKASYEPAVRQPYSNFEQEQITSDVPTIVLYVLKDGFSYNRDLKGYSPNQVTPFDDMMNVDIQ
ncbi:MAG: peptide ABC transporter substrate-binding protein [Candidatus Eremiobacteraeota bacterium]|nr:peptide ABC transporter substrate-binding protein [Candidatus Eremiobacteraeota bacterium]